MSANTPRTRSNIIGLIRCRVNDLCQWWLAYIIKRPVRRNALTWTSSWTSQDIHPFNEIWVSMYEILGQWHESGECTYLFSSSSLTDPMTYLHGRNCVYCSYGRTSSSSNSIRTYGFSDRYRQPYFPTVPWHYLLKVCDLKNWNQSRLDLTSLEDRPSSAYSINPFVNEWFPGRCLLRFSGELSSLQSWFLIEIYPNAVA